MESMTFVPGSAICCCMLLLLHLFELIRIVPLVSVLVWLLCLAAVVYLFSVLFCL